MTSLSSFARPVLLAGAVAVAGIAVPVAAAHAQADTTAPASADRLASAKTRCRNAITSRLGHIEVLQARASASGPLTDAHTATITAFLAAATDGLTARLADVDAATTAEQLKAACSKIVPDFRIYALRTPQVHLAIGFDAADQAHGRLEGVADKLQAAIDAGQGGNIPLATEKLAAMRVALDAAAAATAGHADALLAVTPVDYNADHAVLAPYRASLVTAKGHLREAARLARDAAAALRES
jgi:hypothetical protein